MAEYPARDDDLRGVVAVGDVLAGKYRVERVIGVGGMGVVVAAMHLELDELVAIKLLLPQALGNAEAVARFSREARAAVKIKSEHVARVIDVGKLDSGAPYIVMEYLSGRDLGAMIEQREALPIPDVVDYILQASEAVAEAHVLGIVHRDLKPGNLFVTRRSDGTPQVKVLDFGISKVTSGTAPLAGDAMTRTSAIMGTPLYMSPEQMVSARRADARSDIWALGAILYELVAGVPPFDGETLPNLCTAILHTAPRPIAKPGTPPGLERVILRCLEKEPARRYQDIGQFAAALAVFGKPSAQASVDRIVRVLGAAPARPLDAAPAPSPAARSAPQTDGAWTVSRPRRSTGATVALFAVAFLAVSSLGAFLIFGSLGPARSNVTAGAEPMLSTSTPIAGTPAVIAVAAPTASEPAASATAEPSATAVVSSAPSATVVKAAPRRPSSRGPAPPVLLRDRN